MASGIRVRAQEKNGVVNFKALMRHPMDSGFVKDSDGNTIPAHYIETVTVQNGEKVVLTAYWGPAVSKDPYLELRFKGASKGDELTVSWVDNEGQTAETTTQVR